MVHIGEIIKRVLVRKGVSKSEFGRRISRSRENVYSIFKRPSLDTALLQEIGKALEYDFFSHYTPLGVENEILKNEVRQLRSVLSYYQQHRKD